jgi:hypothetical protein
MPISFAGARVGMSLTCTMIIAVTAWLMLEFARNIVFRFDNANSVML